MTQPYPPPHDPGPPGPGLPPASPPRNYQNAWVIGGLALLIGFGIGAAAFGLGGDDSSTAKPQTVRSTVTVTAPAPTADPTTDESEPPEATLVPTEPADEVLALGESAAVGDSYRVSVQAVEKNADQTLADANSFNDPPKGQYVLVDLKTTYVGNREGDPWIDLTVKFVGTDARQYDEYQCAAVVPHPSIDVPTLESGGSATFQICFDVPPKAIEGGRLFIEDAFSFDEETRVYWNTD